MRNLLIAAALLLLSNDELLAQEPVFDLHVHLWKGAESIRAYEDHLRAANVEATGFAGMWFGGPNHASQGEGEQTRKRNDELIALAKKHPKMLPVATVHPYDGESALTELQRVAAQGVKLLKIHPHTQNFDASDPRVLTLARRAGELGVIVLMDNANILPGDSEKLFNLALQAPKTKFIFAHMGGLNFRFWNVLKLARTAEKLFANNIYFDISAMLMLAADSPIEEEFIWTIRNVGVDQVLLGSDYPQLTLPQTLDALNRLGLSESEKAKIRYDNASKLLRVEPVP